MTPSRTTIALGLSLSAALGTIAGTMVSAAAAVGDKSGWQLQIEGDADTERQFLIYVARDDGPRILTLACERDADTFRFVAEDLSEFVGPVAKATMTLSGGPAKFNIPGVIEPDPETQALGFVAEIPLSNGGLQQLASTLPQLLLSSTPIRIAFGAKSRDLPAVQGMLDPAKRFLNGCLNGK